MHGIELGPTTVVGRLDVARQQIVPELGGTTYTVSIGGEEGCKMHGKEHLKARLDIVNLTDNVVELRNDSGVGVNPAQYGVRFGVFGGISYVF